MFPKLFLSLSRILLVERGKFMDLKLRVIPKPEPGTRNVFEPSRGEVLPVFEGIGDVNLLCGNCGGVLAKTIEKTQLQNVVIHCPVCGFYNAIP